MQLQPTIEFTVDLTGTVDSSVPFPVDQLEAILAQRSIYIPVLNDNIVRKHGETFTLSGTKARELKKLADQGLFPLTYTVHDKRGFVISDFGTDDDECLGLILQGEKIIAVGFSGDPDVNFLIARYNSNGTLDDSFGVDGFVITDFLSDIDGVSSVPHNPLDDKIWVIGYTVIESDYNGLIARFHADGTLDTSFGDSGRVAVSLEEGTTTYFTAAAIQNDGKIVVVGNHDDAFVVIRFNDNGDYDEDFGDNGVVTFGDGAPAFVAVLDDGKILVGGTDTSSGADFTLLRFTDEGLLDPSFGTSGQTVVDFFGDGDAGNAGALQADGKVVIGGAVTLADASEHFGLCRFNTDGSLDETFGIDGKVTTRFGTSSSILSNSVIIAGDKIIAGGYYDTANFALARYNLDGSLDHSFGIGGKVTEDLGTEFEAINALAIQTDGKILAGGLAFPESVYDVAIARFNTDGTLDKTFGT